MEEWRDIPGGEGAYQVSNFGHVRSVDRKVKNSGVFGQVAYKRAGGVLKCYKSKKGYIITQISINGKTITRRVHCLVAMAFIGVRPESMQVNHIDGNKENNHVSNLEYVTGQQNIDHAVRMGLFAHGKHKDESNGNAKLTNEQVLVIKELIHKSNNSLRDIANYFEVSPTTITYINLGKSWRDLGDYVYPLRSRNKVVSISV